MKLLEIVMALGLVVHSASGMETIDADLLIVGGNESGCAAAVQAARLGVKRIVLVNDIQWLGGQFSAEGVGCLDEWTTVDGKRTNFPRSGLFREVVDRIRAWNSATYGIPAPGNAYCGTETIEPAAAARIFEDLLAPYTERGTGQIQVLRPWQPVSVTLDGNRVTGVEFTRGDDPATRLAVRATITLDSSDWGDVIRLSGARYGAGPDPRSRFNEPSAPEQIDAESALEMNPISWCLVLREADHPATIARPSTYDPRSFAQLDSTPPWVDSDMSDGIYSPTGWSIYTHRRLVDRWHNGLTMGTEATFLNWPVQDYPLCHLPQRVIDALEASEPGASKKNLVNLLPEQREIIFKEARLHALGLLYHLQTKVHDRVGDFPQSFRYMRLTEEFGTPDRLPPKPYVREGLRLEALYMLREQDIRATDHTPLWAKVMVPDGVFGFQFNIDFHPTRRQYLDNGDRNGPWQFVHTGTRNWHTDTDRALFPLRSLVPIERDGLMGCSKNIGVSSVVQSALRLHGQMMLVGQASATVAWMSLRDQISPREIAASTERWREIQQRLVRGVGGPGVLIWPWHDLPLDATCFEAANLLPLLGIWQPDATSVHFRPQQTVTRRELARTLFRLTAFVKSPKEPVLTEPRYTDVPATDPDRVAIETMIAWGDFGDQQSTFQPDAEVNWSTLHRWLTALHLPASRGLIAKSTASLPLNRGECVRMLWPIANIRPVVLR